MDQSKVSARRVVAVTAAAMMLPAVGAFAQGPPAANEGTPALTVPFELVEDRDVDDRLARPEDRYALAGGCYTIEAPGHGHVTRTGAGLALADDAASAEPFHFQPTRLGEYLVVTNEGRDTAHPGAWWDVRGYLAAAGLLPELPLDELGLPLPGDGLLDEAPLPPPPTTDEVTVASEPGEAAEWRVVAAGDDPDARHRNGQDYVLTLPSEGRALTVADGSLALVDGPDSDSRFVFHHVPDDDPDDDDHNGTACATWPEISTDTSGAPAPVRGNPAGEVEGFFEAHIHGMAFEFLGGELRCGRPWHPYGVEYALPDCREDGQVLNSGLEALLAGSDPSTYDPVGWPTFTTWPHHSLYTHEQFYWKWLERTHPGGLRLMTNLLVENIGLCELYPQKRNSCNEMDSIRLQADRLFELQDYIDAQSGGPGEGWFRIVTTPTQAREVINQARLAVVLGIEVSILFDCGEVLDQPQCTAEQIDERVQEVHDMGVRQVELINKFDNALSGVAGDTAETGLIVNQGNKRVTGHYWDMRTCPEEAGHGHAHGMEGTQHDKTQVNVADDTPLGEAGGDALAGAILNEFGGLTSVVAPAYPPAPHCNSRGLTDLGAHAIRRIIEKGILFDPDHMSAAGQREALDLIETEIIPEMQAEARGNRTAARWPGLISSHSWANDITYQRILQLGGSVAPMQSDAATFADRWAQRRQWAEQFAPDGVEFGMGYGADTNGFASQGAPRKDPARSLAYTDEGFRAPIGDVTLYQHSSGLREFDVTADGLAHYGMYADWFHEVALAADEHHAELGGGDQVLDDMLAGAENYLQMWERAVHGGNECVADQSTFQVEDLHALLGGNVEGFLRAVGQPVDREGAAYTYCVAGAGGETTPVDVVFDEEGQAERVEPHRGGITPAPAPDDDHAAPGASSAPKTSVAADGHDHLHPAPAASAPLPATGGGAASAAILLLGATLAGSALLDRRRRAPR